jgi:hypothetical protein
MAIHQPRETSSHAERPARARAPRAPPSPPLPGVQLSPHEAPKQVVWEGLVPQGSSAPCLHEALQQLCPERYATATAAKRAVRRREVMVDGLAIKDPSL